MSKAIQGAAQLAGAAALGGLAFIAPSVLAIPGYAQAMSSLALTGISSEMGAIANALTSNRGMQITDRRPASNRTIVYGTQMIGGTLIYESVTGHQYNQIIVLSGHSIHSIQAIYLDGRKVYFKGSGNGWSVRNGVGFGGDADTNDHLGPDNVTKYNFGGKVFVEARYGDQAENDVMGSMTGNDPSWAYNPATGDSPSLVGCAYIYLKCTASNSQFPQRPEVKILVNGKDDVWDPRTNATGFTNNAALILADVIRDQEFGLGDINVNNDQLIAAANICDEQVPVAALNGGTESRYCCDWNYDTGSPVSDVLQTMLQGMAGRLSYVGGEWFIFPGAYIAPTLTFDKTSITATPQWSPRRSVRDLPNRVTGTHISAEYPFSVAGSYYQNRTETQNNFDLKFTQSSFPYYAQDQLHGYPASEWLTQDGGRIRPMELSLPTVLSVTQCQRVAKINLMRARALQGSGTLELSLGAYQLAPCSTMNFNFEELGWTNEILEVLGTALRVEKVATDEGEAFSIRYALQVQQTGPSIYAWSTIEELTVKAAPAGPQTPLVPNPPTNMQLMSGANTAITTSEGLLIAVLQVTWDTPLDNLATAIQVQYRPTGSPDWLGGPQVDISLNTALITTVAAGQHYDVRIRTLRANGATSDWLEEDNFLVPALEGNLGALASQLASTQGFIGKFWRIASVADIPATGGDLSKQPLFKASANTVNYALNVAGQTDYGGYAKIQKIPAPADGGDLQNIYGRFTGSIIAPATGTYTVGANSDDGSRLTVGDTVLYDALHVSQGSPGDKTYTNSATVDLVAGTSYQLVLEFQNGVGSGCVQLLWTLPGSSDPILLDLGASYTSAGSTTYADGTPVQVLQPATPGADKTSDQTIVYAGISGNLVPNGDFLLRNIQGWLGGSYNAEYNAIIVPGNNGAGVSSPTFALQPGNKYRFTFKGWASGNNAQGTYLRVIYGAVYSPNLSAGYIGYQDFIGNGQIAVNDTNATYTYDWTAPADARFAVLAMYSTGAGSPDLAFTHVAAQDYAAAAQWGADQTSSNTSADTSAVSGVPSYVIANVVPNGYKVILNPGNRTYSIQAL